MEGGREGGREGGERETYSCLSWSRAYHKVNGNIRLHSYTYTDAESGERGRGREGVGREGGGEKEGGEKEGGEKEGGEKEGGEKEGGEKEGRDRGRETAAHLDSPESPHLSEYVQQI